MTMKTLRWTQLSISFQHQLIEYSKAHSRDIDDRDVRFEQIIKSNFGYNVQVTHTDEGAYWWQYTFMFDEKDYTHFLLKFS